MKGLFASLALGLAVLFAACSHAQTPAQWNYNFNAQGVATATYPGNVICANGCNGAAVVNVASLPGASVDAQISNCVNALPAAGGVCDARGITSGIINGFTIAKSGVTLLGPCGALSVTGTIQFKATGGISQDTWLGCGGGYQAASTTLTWAGNSTAPMIQLVGARTLELGDFSIVSNAAAPLAVGIQQQTQTGAVATDDYYHDIIMQGTNGGLGIGIEVCAGTNCGGAGSDSNNDIGTVRRVQVNNYVTAAYSLEGTQAKGWLFDQSACISGEYCVATLLGPSSVGGAFTAINMAGGDNTIADFGIGAPNDAIIIIGGSLEGSNRLLTTSGATSSPWPITIIGTRWAENGMNADNNVIIYTQRGGLNLIGLDITGPSASQAPQFDFAPSGNAAVAVATGNVLFWGTGLPAATSTPFVGAASAEWRAQGNELNDGAGDVIQVVDTIGGGQNSTQVGSITADSSSTARTLTTTGTCATVKRTPNQNILAGALQNSAAACTSAQTIIMTGTITYPHGIACNMADITHPADTPLQSGSSTTSATFAVPAAGTPQSDLLSYMCIGY